jgi:hypothetical protein
MGDHATNMAEAIHYMVMGQALTRERPKADVVSGLSIAAAHGASQGASHELGDDWLAPVALPSAG